MEGWNVRYVFYAQAHGRGPDDMAEHDKVRWPGGRMTGFILWINEQWEKWNQLHKRVQWDPKTPEDHTHFDAWLKERVSKK